MSGRGFPAENRSTMSMSEVVCANARHVCELLGWDGLEFGARLVELGLDRDAQIGYRIWEAKRKIPVDELVLIAVALDVSPMALLSPPAGVRIRHAERRGIAGEPVLEDGLEVLGARFLHHPGDSKYDGSDGEEQGASSGVDDDGRVDARPATADQRRERVLAWEDEVWSRARVPLVFIAPEVLERASLISELASADTVARLDAFEWDWDAASLPELERWDRMSTDQLRARRDLRRRARGDIGGDEPSGKPGSG